MAFNKKFNDYTQREFIFLNADWNDDNRAEFLQQKYSLAKQKTLLEIEKARLDNLQIALDKEKAQLDSFCLMPDSKQKIELIAAGILRKNFKFVQKLEETDNTLKQLAEKIKHTKEQMDILQTRLALEKYTTFYKVNSSNRSKNSIASLIADAILNDPQAVQLVARSSGNNLEMEKNWELMSDIERDDLISKKIVRNL
jgi:hypothetical protein